MHRASRAALPRLVLAGCISSTLATQNLQAGSVNSVRPVPLVRPAPESPRSLVVRKVTTGGETITLVTKRVPVRYDVTVGSKGKYRRHMIDLRDPTLDPAAVRAALGLVPHPEGGAYRETWRDLPADGGRGAGTAILFLLEAGEASTLHRVDAAELWLWHAGAPLSLTVEGQVRRLGPSLDRGENLQAVVPPHAWQSARSEGAWTLVSCIVAPAFSFAGFELAP